jgi:hypothetical protein
MRVMPTQGGPLTRTLHLRPPDHYVRLNSKQSGGSSPNPLDPLSPSSCTDAASENDSASKLSMHVSGQVHMRWTLQDYS